MDDILAPEWLDATMTAAGIKTSKLADESGISRSQIQRIRNGESARTNTLRLLREAMKRLAPIAVSVPHSCDHTNG